VLALLIIFPAPAVLLLPHDAVVFPPILLLLHRDAIPRGLVIISTAAPGSARVIDAPRAPRAQAAQAVTTKYAYGNKKNEATNAATNGPIGEAARHLGSR
jgi:hypothetical protein